MLVTVSGLVNETVDIRSAYVEAYRDGSGKVYYIVIGKSFSLYRVNEHAVKAFDDLDEAFALLDELRAGIDSEELKGAACDA